MGTSFFSDGLQFSCKECSHCCRHEPGFVYLSDIDINNLATCLNVSTTEFTKKYCRVVPYFDGREVFSLREKSNFDCIFWQNGCLVYKNRPIQCSTYPFWGYILESKKRWDEEGESCPGINSGALLNENEIYATLETYEKNRASVCSCKTV